jgi:hypothetical protein
MLADIKSYEYFVKACGLKLESEVFYVETYYFRKAMEFILNWYNYDCSFVEFLQIVCEKCKE